MASTGAFREDLWYRLNVATIRIPPLRERPDDIELLAVKFLDEFCVKECTKAVGFTQLAMSALLGYPWPGNVRQLRAVVERASLLCPGQRVDIGHLPPQLSEPPPVGSGTDLAALSWNDALTEARAGAARYYLEEVLRRHGGNVAGAAAHAGVERESYYRLLRRYGAKVKDEDGRGSVPPPSDSNPPPPDESE
jgi:two-component system response regulator HydG